MAPAPTAPGEKPWTLLQHPDFKLAFGDLVAEVKALKATSPDAFKTHGKTKLLKRVVDLVFSEIPGDPTADQYQLGNTMGESFRRWRRAKFLGRFRLFFRFDTATRVIIYGWVNDENTLRKAGSKTDPYAVFKARLTKGDPPTDWAELLETAEPLSLPELDLE